MIKRKLSSRVLMMVLIAVLLSACTKGDSDLLEWINVVKNKPAPPLEPLPLVQDPPAVEYSPVGLRDPFARPPLNRMSNTGGPSPDLNRRRQPLEAYTLDTLNMVGSIGTGSALSALVLAPDKVTYKVRPGAYLGQSDGRVVAVSADRIELIELVPNGNGGWLERQAVIALNESNSGDKK